MDFRDQFTLNVKVGAFMDQICRHATLPARTVCSWVSDQVGYGC